MRHRLDECNAASRRANGYECDTAVRNKCWRSRAGSEATVQAVRWQISLKKANPPLPMLSGSFRTSEFIASPLGPDDAIYTSPEVEVGIEFNSQSEFMQPEASVQLVLTLSNEAGTIRSPNARALTR